MEQTEIAANSGKKEKMSKWLLTGGALAGPFFTVAWFIEGITRPDYNPLRHLISSLAIGPAGWTQALNFLITGLLTLVLSVGVWRTMRTRKRPLWGTLLIGTVAIGLIGAGFFMTDPVLTVILPAHRLFTPHTVTWPRDCMTCSRPSFSRDYPLPALY